MTAAKNGRSFALLWENLLVNRFDLLGELPLLTTQKSGQVLVDAEVSADKSLLMADLGIHAPSSQHHSVVVLQSNALPETFNQPLCSW